MWSEIKKIILVPFTILLAVGLGVLLFRGGEKLMDRATAAQNPAYPKGWHIKNDGQVVNGQNGTPGVDLNLVRAWKITQGAPEVLVGILGESVDIRCKEITDRIYVNERERPDDFIDNDENGYVDDINGWNFHFGNNQMFDNALEHNGGNFPASIIGGSHATGEIKGVAPEVTLLPLPFLRGGKGTLEHGTEGIAYAHQKGVRIIYCGWDSSQMDQKMYQTMKHYSDILFICSAGSKGEALEDVPVYPGYYQLPNVICVAAIDNRGNLESNSGYGTGVHIAAPGADMYGLNEKGKEEYRSGTAAAAANAAGVAALIQSRNPDLSAVQIGEILKQNAAPLDSLTGKVESGGVLDAYRCLKAAR